MVSIGPNFFYTVTLPCTLWFIDKNKKGSLTEDRVLFIDASEIYNQIDRAHRDFTPEQIEFIANIVRLYRGEKIENLHFSKDLMDETFPDGKYIDVSGLCKIVSKDKIIEHNYSLNPGRYVGFTERIDDDFDFDELLQELCSELNKLNIEAHELEEIININVKKLMGY